MLTDIRSTKIDIMSHLQLRIHTHCLVSLSSIIPKHCLEPPQKKPGVLNLFEGPDFNLSELYPKK